MTNFYKMEYDRQHKKKSIAWKAAGIVGIFLIVMLISLTAHAEEETIAVIYSDEYLLKQMNKNVTEVGIAPNDVELSAQNGANAAKSTAETAKTAAKTQHEYSDISMTEDEYEMLRRIVAAEAQTQNLEGRKAVVEVIFNRVLSKEYPSSVYGVLSQRGQFTSYKYRNASWVEPKYADAAIKAVLDQGRTVLPDTGYVYFSRGKSKYGTAWIKIQDHWFGKAK